MRPAATLILARAAAGCLPVPLPLGGGLVPAGFPSPADDYVERRLDLNEHLVANPESTFFVRVAGDSMTGAGILDGDILVVDRALRARRGQVVVAVVDGEFTVKRLGLAAGRLALLAEHPGYAPIVLDEGRECEIWGVVRHAIHAL